jgi:hypothetical protein
MIPAPPPGVHPDIAFETYLVWDAVDYTFLKHFAHTPNYSQWKRTNPSEEKQAYAKGRAFHCLSLEKHKADEQFVIQPETYTDAKGVVKPWHGASNTCKAWKAAQVGKTILDEATFAQAAGMALRVRKLPQMEPFLADAQVELSVVWVDALTGLTCKARFDAFKNGIIVDLKSTSGSAAPRAWFDECQRYKYYLQVAHYIDGAKTLKIAGAVPWFAFCVCEAYEPFDLAMYDCQDDLDALSYDFVVYGKMKRAILMGAVKHCMATGVWPGYSLESHDQELTYQARKEFEEMSGR